MDSRSDRMRTNVEGDRLSSLPDDLLVKILFLVGAKQAVETCVLSSRWRFIWTKLPFLAFSSEDFTLLRKFHKFFTHVMSSYNNQVGISLDLHGKVSQVFVQRILNYAFSHNIQRLKFMVLPEKNIEVPLFLFSSRSLKHLFLVGPTKDYFITPISTWELPALTWLNLDRFTLYDDSTDKCVGLFSKCPNLKSLTLNNCRVLGLNSFTICHPKLSSLVLNNRKWCVNVVNVIAPQLKTLAIVNCDGNHMISAPELTSLKYSNRLFQLFVDVDSFTSLEKVGLHVCNPYNAGAQKIVDLFNKFNRVKFLTLSLEIVEFLASSLEVIANQPSPFVNLRSLRIFPELFDEPHGKKVDIPMEVINYLVDSSPGATVTTVTREKIRAMRDAKSVHNLMEELKVLLDKEKTPKENHQEDSSPQPWTKTPLHMSERVSQIESIWKGLDEQIKQAKTKTIPIITLMQRIKDLLITLPTSYKAELLPRFYALCEEARIAIGKIVNHMKIECHTKESGLSDNLRELFTAALSSRLWSVAN